MTAATGDEMIARGNGVGQSGDEGAPHTADVTVCLETNTNSTKYTQTPRTTVSQDVQTRFSVQLAFAKFLSKIKGNFWESAVSMILALY